MESDRCETVNPITKTGMLHELLRELNDVELNQFIGYWRHRRERFQKAGDGFSAWKTSILLSAGLRERVHRQAGQTVPEVPTNM